MFLILAFIVWRANDSGRFIGGYLGTSKSFTFVFDSDHNLIRLVDKIGGGRKDSSGSERQKNRFIIHNLKETTHTN